MRSPAPVWDVGTAPFSTPYELSGLALESSTHACCFESLRGLVRWSLEGGGFEHAPMPADPNPATWHALAFSRDARRVAVAQHERPLQVFDRESSRLFEPKLPGAAHSAAFSDDGRRLLVGGMRTVHEVELGGASVKVRALPGHVYRVEVVAYLPDGASALSVDPHAVKRVTLATGRSVTLAGATALTRRDGRHVAGTSTLVVLGEAIVVWDVDRDVEVARWPLPEGGPWRIVSADARGPTVVLASWSLPRTVLFDLGTGEARALDTGWCAPVTAARTADGSALVMIGRSRSARASASSLLVLDFTTGLRLRGPLDHSGGVLALTCTENPPRVWSACVDGAVYAKRVGDGATEAITRLPDHADVFHTDASGGTPRVVLRRDGHYSLYDAGDGALLGSVSLREDTSGTWLLDSANEAITSEFHSRRLVRTRLRDGAEECVFDAPASPGSGLLASPDGAWVLRVGMDRTDVWRASDGALVRSLKLAARGWSGTVGFTPDGATLVVPTNKAAFVLYDFVKGRARATLKAPDDLADARGCTALVIDPRGRFFVASFWTPTGATLLAWDLTARTVCARFDWALPGLGRVSAMALGRDGAMLIAGSSGGALRAWDLTGIA